MRSIPARLWALTALSGVLQVLPFPIAGPVPLWRTAFCWFAVTPLLMALLGQGSDGRPLRAKQAALLGYTCGCIWYLGNCYWIYQTMYLYGGLAKPIAAGILILFCLYVGLYHALFGGLIGLLRGRLGVQGTLLLTPFVWVAVELARARITGFPWDLLGYTQVDNGALTMLAPLGGVMLLSFTVLAINALFAEALLTASCKLRRNLAVAAVLLAMAGQYGMSYHPPADDAGSSHYATLLQENLSVGVPGRAAESLSNAEEYRQFSAASRAPDFLMEEGTPEMHWMGVPQSPPPDLVVWPEAPADFITSDPVFRTQLSAFARSIGAPVVVGSVGVDRDPAVVGGYREYGSAAVFDKDGSSLGRYDKIHRVPWGEYVPYKQLFSFAGKLVTGVGNMDAGTQHSVFRTNGHALGIFICYESIFGDEVREFVKNGAEVLINISDDGWYGDTSAPWQHLNMARMRAIENRRWLLRDTNTGVTTAIDPHGRGVFTTPRHLREAFAFTFDYRSDTTFYTRHGDWFAWSCAALTLLAFLIQRKCVQ